MKETKERFDLEKITKNIERDYKPINVRPTSYEQEQEENAIISYDELVQQINSNKINYDTNYIHDNEIDVKKIDVDNEVPESTKQVDDSVNGLTCMNYEKEEDFLKALKQLQSTLVR